MCTLNILCSFDGLFRIIERSEMNKMPVDSIARVFGPTIIGSTSSDPKVAIKDIEKQKLVSLMYPYNMHVCVHGKINIKDIDFFLNLFSSCLPSSTLYTLFFISGYD